MYTIIILRNRVYSHIIAEEETVRDLFHASKRNAQMVALIETESSIVLTEWHPR